jgi:hypothetical protein
MSLIKINDIFDENKRLENELTLSLTLRKCQNLCKRSIKIN